MAFAVIGTSVGIALGSQLIGSVFGSPSSGGISASQSQMQQTIFGDQQYYNNLLQQLIADPSSVSKTPTYQFAFGQGEQAVQRAGAASGGTGPGSLVSGNEGAALVQYGQGLATQTLTQQENLLTSLSGLTAPTSAGQAGSNAISAQQNQFTQLGAILASLGYGGKMLGGSAGSVPTYTGQYSGGGGTSGDPSQVPIIQ